MSNINEKPSTSSLLIDCNVSAGVANLSDDNNSSNYIPIATAIPFEMIEHGDIIANIITRAENTTIFPEPSAPPKEEVEEDERELIFATTGLIDNSSNDNSEEEWTWYVISDDDTKLSISKDDTIPSSAKIKNLFQQQKTNSILVSKVAYEKVTSIIDCGTKSVNKAAFKAALLANEKYKCYCYRPRPSSETQIDNDIDIDSSNNDNNEEELAWYIISNEDLKVPSPSDDATHSPKKTNYLKEQKTKCVFVSKVAYEKLTSMIDYGSKSFNEAKVIANQKYYCYYYRPKPSSERELDCNSCSNHVDNPFEIELKEFGTTV